jgi:hypothetical protein
MTTDNLDALKSYYGVPTTGTIQPMFEHVQNVSEHISEIESLGLAISNGDINPINNNIADVSKVGQNITSVNTVSTNISAVAALSIHGSALEDISQNIQAVIDAGIGIGHIVNISENMSDVSEVGSNIDDVVTLAGVASDVKNVSNHIADVSKSALNIGSIASVANDLSRNFSHIDDYGSITDPVETENQGISYIRQVAENIDWVVKVGPAVSDVQTVVGQVVPYMTEVLDAGDNANLAVLKASDAENYATAAQNAKSLARQYRDEADVSRHNALQSESEANISEAYAKKWANDDYNVEVAPGQYSAKHWATVANNIVGEGVIDDGVTGELTTWSSYKIDSLIQDINAILQSDDTTLDELQEIVNFIKQNKNDLQSLDLSNIAETTTLKHFTDALKTKLNGIEDGATRDQNAGEVAYDNTQSGRTAKNVKAALDEPLKTIDYGLITESVS